MSSCGREEDRGDAALGSKGVKVGHERQKNNRPLRAAEGRSLRKAIEDRKVGGKETIDADSGCGSVEEELRPANGTCWFETHVVHGIVLPKRSYFAVNTKNILASLNEMLRCVLVSKVSFEGLVDA